MPEANPPLTAEEQSAATRLTDADFQIIDAAILANASVQWLKVARVVLRTENALRPRYPELSCIFYAQRLVQLEEDGRLVSQGNLEYMRFSEVRLPTLSK